MYVYRYNAQMSKQWHAKISSEYLRGWKHGYKAEGGRKDNWLIGVPQDDHEPVGMCREDGIY